MDTNKIKTAFGSQSKGSSNRKATTSRASAGTTAKRAATAAVGRGKRNRTTAKRSAATKAAEPSAQQRAQCIAVAAYFLAEQRAFAPNHELDDWLAAERSL